jgi:hypothetical protein
MKGKKKPAIVNGAAHLAVDGEVKASPINIVQGAADIKVKLPNLNQLIQMSNEYLRTRKQDE